MTVQPVLRASARLFAWVCVFVNTRSSKKDSRLFNGRENLLPRVILLPLELMTELSLLLWKQFRSLRDGEPVPEIWKNDYSILSALLYLCFRRQLSAKYDAMKKCCLERNTGNMKSSLLVPQQ